MANRNNIDAALERIGQEIIDGFQEEIRSSNKVSTGRLLNSFTAEVIDGSLEIRSSEDYAGAVDEGRGVTKSKGPDLQSALQEWISRKRITIRSFGKKRGGRFIKRTDNAVKGVAFIMARKIHNGGYGEKFGVAEFTSKTMNRLMDTITQQLGDEYLQYITESVQETITNRLKNVD